MAEAETAKPSGTTPVNGNVYEAPRLSAYEMPHTHASESTRPADEPPRIATVEARDTLSLEATAAQQLSSTELSRALAPIATAIETTREAGGSQPFAVGMDASGLTGYSVDFADGSKVEYENNQPQQLTGPDGSTTKFRWQGGKLNSIQLQDGSSWNFEDGKWQHLDAAGKPGSTADGLRFENRNGTAIINGPITETTLKPLTDGYLAPPETNMEVLVRQSSTSAPLSMSPETLATAVDSVRNNLQSPRDVEATLRAIPPENRPQFEQIYREKTNRDLRSDLRNNKMNSAIDLLDPREDARQASWLQGNLASLTRLGQFTNNNERALIEHNIRLNLRGMSDTDRQSLSDELLKKTGKNLVQTLQESAMSAPSREIATIYATHGNNLSPDQLRDVTEIALNSRSPNAQKLLMLKEAFSGDSDTPKQARQQFLGNNGEGESRLRQVFGDTDLFRQARDYAQNGRLDTATFIDLQRSNLANNEKGVELVLHSMTPEQRQMLWQGQKLALAGKTAGATPAETEALRYFQRINEALGRAAERITSPSRWSETNRSRTVTNWLDIAVNGEQTLLGRLATSEGRQGAINAITNFTEQDKRLISDPAYRNQVWNLIGGPPGTEETTAYSATRLSGIETEAARETLAKIFPESLPTDASAATRYPTLAEAAENAVRFERREPYTPHGPDYVFEALMHAKPEDYAALTSEQRRMINGRVALVPDGARDAARAMVARLQAGQDIPTSAAEYIYLAKLQNASPQSIAEAILKQPQSVRLDPRMEQAARFAFGQDFERYGKSVLDGNGIDAANLFEMNVQRGLIPLFNGFDHQNYYNGLKLIPSEQREQILSASERARANDPEAKRLLDKSFGNLSAEQREVALNVLRNPNQEFTLTDQIRAKSLGANIDEQRLIDDFARMTPQDRLGQINDYASRHRRFLVDDLSKNANENQRQQIDLSLPMSRGDLSRAFRDSVLDNSQGLYGNTAVTEISIGEAQNRFQTQLIDRLPLELRQQAELEIERSFQKYVKALRENNDAKDQYARDLSDKIMLAVTTIGGVMPVGTTMVRLALTAATAVATRGTSEHLIKGSLTRDDITQAAILGTIDGALLGRFTAFQGIFEKSLTNTISTQVGNDVTKSVLRTMDSDLQTYFRLGERGRADFEAGLIKTLQRRGVRDPEAISARIINTLRVEGLPIRMQAAFVENPGAQEAVQQLFQFGQKSALQKVVDRGLMTPEQLNSLNARVNQMVQNFAENPQLRESAINDMRRMTDNLRFIAEKATDPVHARAYTDVLIMATTRKNVPIPLETLRTAEPRMLAFYRDQMSGALNNFRRPGADTVAGARYEYAMQHEIMEALSRSNNPEARNWVFIPGAKGSTADHAGLDGALIHIKDGRILPIDLKNYQIGDQTRWATHIEGRVPANFNNREVYDQATGRLIENIRPDPGAVEDHLMRLIEEHDNWIIKPGTFAELNPASSISFPGLGDTPLTGDVAAMRAQAAGMRQFIQQADNTSGNSNLALLRQRLQNPQAGNSGGLRFLESEIARLAATQPVRPVVNETTSTLARLRTVDPTVTELEASKVSHLRSMLSSNNPGRELPTDRTLIAAQRAFDRLRIEPAQADMAAILAAKTPAELERAATDGVLRHMADVIKELAGSRKAEDARLLSWAGLFINRQSGSIDRGMIAEIAKAPAERRNLQVVLERVYKQFAPQQRPALIDRALDRLANL
jgi:hypothetical protein